MEHVPRVEARSRDTYRETDNRTGTQKERLRQREIVRDPGKGAEGGDPKREGQRPRRDRDTVRDSSRDVE